MLPNSLAVGDLGPDLDVGPPALAATLLDQLRKVEASCRAAIGLADSAPIIRDAADLVRLRMGLRIGNLLLSGKMCDLSLRGDNSQPEKRLLQEPVKAIVFNLLHTLDISLPPAQETEIATRLFWHLVGEASLAEYQELKAWLRKFRADWQAEGKTDPRARLLVWLVPHLVAQNDGDPPTWYHISFRLFLRGRLARFCRDNALQPGRDGLCEALERLTPKVLDQFISQAVRVPELDPAPRVELQKISEKERALAGTH